MGKTRKNVGTSDNDDCCIEDHFEAARWAAFVLDFEAVVTEFNLILFWEYKNFLTIAEKRNIIHLHRCAFYPTQSLGKDRKLNTLAFERVERLLLNTAKDVWLESICPTSENLVHLKRSVTGLYLLYYLWTTQGQSDNCKILISFTPADQIRLRVFHERLERLFSRIPNSTEVGKCILYIVESLKARHAFQYNFRSEEARLDREYLQLIRVKNLSEIRPVLMSIHSNSHYESLLIWLESLCRKMSTILSEAEKSAQVPVKMSTLVRNFLPENVIRNRILLDPTNFKPVMLRLPANYIIIAEQIIRLVQQNFTAIRRPFLTMESLLQVDHVTRKFQQFARLRELAMEKKQCARKKQFSDNLKAFNQKCIEANRQDKMLKERHRPYRDMDSYAWDFIHQRMRADAKNFNENSILRSILPNLIPITNEELTVSTSEELIVPTNEVLIFEPPKQPQKTQFKFQIIKPVQQEQQQSLESVNHEPSDSFDLMDLDEEEKRIQSQIGLANPMIAFESTKVLKDLF